MKKPLLAVALASTLAGTAAADDAVFELGIVEVVAPAPDDAANARAEVVDADAIEKHARRDVSEALELLPGVTVQNIGQRSERLVYVRGFNSRQVPLFIDGIPVYVPYDGNVDLARFTADDLSQVVVTKGLTSVLYGPNALGGSINLVSRRPTEPLEGAFSYGTEFDSDGDRPAQRANARIATHQGTWYAQANITWQERDWFRMSDDAGDDNALGASEDGGRRNNSGSEDATFGGKIGFTPNATDEYVLSYYHLDGSKQTPPYAGRAPGVNARFWRWPEWNKESLYFIGRTALSDATTLRLRAYHDAFDNTLESYDDATYTTQTRGYAFTSVYDDYTVGGSAELEQRWAGGQTTRFAVQGKEDVHREYDELDSPQERFEDRIYSIALEHEARFDRWTLTPGVAYHMQRPQRADNLLGDGSIEPFDNRDDSAVGGSFALSYDLSDGIDLFAGVSRKTRFATLKDRYSYRLGSALPNPGLDSEQSDNIEIGIEGAAGMVDYRVALFRSDLDDAIESVTLAPSACSAPPCFQLQNIGEARNEGVELSGGVQLGDRTRLDGTYTYLDRDNITRPDIRPLDTPQHVAFVALDHQWTDTMSTLVSTRHESGRFSATTGARATSSFNVVNANIEWRQREGFGIQAGVLNAGDVDYAYEEGFPEPGRTWFTTLSYRY